MRELTFNKVDISIVIGEWVRTKDKDGITLWELNGRCIHINKGGNTLYLGFMKAGKRHGWGIEIPM